MKTWFRHLLEKFRASAWAVPAAYVVMAIILSQITLGLDRNYANALFGWTEILRTSSPEGSRTLLSTIATSVLALAGVSFSSIMVTMTLASQQFGPRLLRNFLRDHVSQSTLGVLMGTFVYCLFILRGIRSVEDVAFVPQLSSLVGLVLALLCLGVFIRFIQQILSKIQGENVVAGAYRGLEESIEDMFPDEEPEEGAAEETPDTSEGLGVCAGGTGYLQAVNLETLLEIAVERRCRIVVDTMAGRFVTERQRIATVLMDGDEEGGELESEVQACFFIGSVRTPEQDFSYGFRQLVEVALRALSPGINDPHTAMDCIDYLGAGLQKAFHRSLPPSVHRDAKGNGCVFIWTTCHEDLVNAAVDQIRQASSDRCDITIRLLKMLAATARLARTEEQRKAIMTQAELIHGGAILNMSNDRDRESIEARFRECKEACSVGA